MVTLLSHMSHALRPLNVTYFKPFKNVFKKEKDATMASNHYLEPNMVTLTKWVDKALL
jgi:hypothetical protein